MMKIDLCSRYLIAALLDCTIVQLLHCYPPRGLASVKRRIVELLNRRLSINLCLILSNWKRLDCL